MWGYFLFPLLALGCSFLQSIQCSQWVSLSGGYLNLQDMLLNYLETVAAMICVWVAWVVYNLACIRSRPKSLPHNPVSRRDLCLSFNVNKKVLKECQESPYVVVHFDDKGQIIGLERDGSLGIRMVNGSGKVAMQCQN